MIRKLIPHCCWALLLLPAIAAAQTNPTKPTAPAAVAASTRNYPDTTGYTEVTVSNTGNTATNGTNLQTEISNASCNPQGTVIKLVAGVTYDRSATLSLPAKSCAAGKWVIIQTGALAGLPAAGTRVAPADATNMGRIRFTFANGEGIKVQPSAVRYRITGVEITTNASGTGNSMDVVSLGDGGFGGPQDTVAEVPSEIVLERSYVHGAPPTSFPRGGVATHCKECVVQDSYIADIANVGFDSSAIRGWNGTGPVLIENNYLNGAGETIFLGGADSNLPSPNLPSDYTVRRNYFHNPDTWDEAHASWDGVQRQIKNLLEFKMGKRVLVEGNYFSGIWPKAQNGHAWNVKSENQSGNNTWAETAHVEFRYNKVDRQRGQTLGWGGTAGVFADINANIIYAHDNLFIIQCAGTNSEFLLTGGGEFAHVAFQHNTVVASGVGCGGWTVLDSDNDVGAGIQPLDEFAFHDNVIPASIDDPGSTAPGTKENCALGGSEAAWNCFDDPDASDNGERSFHKNLVYNSNNGINSCRSDRPLSTNSTYALNKVACVNAESDVKFANFGTGDYRLCTGVDQPVAGCTASPGVGAGIATDGADYVGASIGPPGSGTAGTVTGETCGAVSGDWSCYAQGGGKPVLPRGRPVPRAMLEHYQSPAAVSAFLESNR